MPSPVMPLTIKRRRRRQLLNEHGSSCYICGCETINETNHPRQTTLDHIIPASMGGRHTVGNLRIACRECNESRDRLPALDEAGEARLLAHIFQVQQGVYA